MHRLYGSAIPVGHVQLVEFSYLKNIQLLLK